MDSALAAGVDDRRSRGCGPRPRPAHNCVLNDTNRWVALPAVVARPAEQLLTELCKLFERDRGAQRALTTMCIDVGQGIAVMLETA